MQEASMKLSLGFGLRLRGLDLLTSLRVSHDGSRDGDAEELQLEDVAPWPHRGHVEGGKVQLWPFSSYEGNRYSYIIDIMVYW